MNYQLTLKLPDKLQPYGLYVYYVVHICDFGMLRVNQYFIKTIYGTKGLWMFVTYSAFAGSGGGPG